MWSSSTSGCPRWTGSRCAGGCANPRSAQLPVIFLSAQDATLDKVLGLELGADDFVSKPFHPRKLGARVRVLLRRVNPPVSTTKKVGDLEIDTERAEARFRGERLDLTTAEFKILSVLARRPGVVFSRDRLIDDMWDGEHIVLDRTVDAHIRRLRKKLGPAASMIKTVRGMGYKLEP